uniref:PlsC domain-containing protein n=1 Tax=Syphacia muris TaxID=451379 RepID=A0A0N5ALF4_9BILA
LYFVIYSNKILAFLFPPVLFIVLTIIVLATFGKSFGIRQKYITFLIKTFEVSFWFYILRNVGDWFFGLQYRNLKRRLLWKHSAFEGIIHREATIPSELGDYEKNVSSKGWAMIQDSTEFLKAGIEAIIEDDVTSRFKAEELATWNMLSRTRMPFCNSTNWKLTLLWMLGFIVRYVILFPPRFIVFFVGFIFLFVSTAAIGLLPNGFLKQNLNEKCMLLCHQIMSRSFTTVVYFHNRENRAHSGGICVANHTSPIDVLILGLDNVYALVGQKHTGFLGVLQRALSRSSSHVWFERSESKDRALVAARLREHVNDPNKLPILIFPEGTCINNTSVMMFKKGCFEAGTTIWPIAMKYDPLFGDAFWNSSEQGWCEYLLRMMTSWAIICNVWYLPPMTKKLEESGIEFANRVKREIAVRGGLVDLEWDGGLKRTKVPKKMLAEQQERYAKRLSRYKSCSEAETKDDSQTAQTMAKRQKSKHELGDDAESGIQHLLLDPPTVTS